MFDRGMNVPLCTTYRSKVNLQIGGKGGSLGDRSARLEHIHQYTKRLVNHTAGEAPVNDAWMATRIAAEVVCVVNRCVGCVVQAHNVVDEVVPQKGGKHVVRGQCCFS